MEKCEINATHGRGKFNRIVALCPLIPQKKYLSVNLRPVDDEIKAIWSFFFREIGALLFILYLEIAYF